MVPQRPFVGQATGPWNDFLLLCCHPSPSLSTVMTLRTQPGNPSRPDRFPVLFYFCSFRVIYFFCVTASSSWTPELMAFPESTLLSLSTVLYFLSFSTLSHTFTSEFCNFLRNQSQGYASWATYKLELGLSNLRQLSLKGRVITAWSAEREGYCDGQETENIHPGIWRYMYVFI